MSEVATHLLQKRIEQLIYERDLARAENEKLRGEATHWRKNHDHKVEQLRIFKQREDLPVDRLPAYRRLVELQEENEKLRAALKPFADCEVWEGYKGYERFVAGMFHIHNKGMDSLNISHIRAARAAYLGEKHDNE